MYRFKEKTFSKTIFFENFIRIIIKHLSNFFYSEFYPLVATKTQCQGLHRLHKQVKDMIQEDKGQLKSIDTSLEPL